MISHSIRDTSQDEYGSLVDEPNKDVILKKNVPLSLCPQQNPHVLFWGRKRIAAFRVRRETSRAIARLELTLRLLMSYIYIYMERLFLMFLDHTQRRSTVGRTPLDE